MFNKHEGGSGRYKKGVVRVQEKKRISLGGDPTHMYAHAGTWRSGKKSSFRKDI